MIAPKKCITSLVLASVPLDFPRDSARPHEGARGAPLLASARVAASQESVGADLNEIVVTATRREESIRRVPIDITALGRSAWR